MKFWIYLITSGSLIRLSFPGKAKGTVSYADDCPIGWEPAPISVQNEICYRLLLENNKYTRGPKFCQEEDPRATMAMPKSDQEIKAVASKVPLGEYAWIGLDDQLQEQQFLFNDEEPLVVSNYKSKPWDTGSPSNDVNKNCVKVWHKSTKSSKFLDEDCRVKLHIVCQIDLYYDTFSTTNVETTSSTFKDTSQSNIATHYSPAENSQSSSATKYSLIENSQSNTATTNNPTETLQSNSVTNFRQLQSAPTSSTPVPNCCLCNHRNQSSSSKFDHMIDKLRMDKKSLSSYKRSKISVEDDRMTAKYLGWFGGLILTLLFCFIVFLDVLQILQASSYQWRSQGLIQVDA